ncbi:hypothetical protein LINPERHAP2_LOCUS29969 [Linum perenne]
MKLRQEFEGVRMHLINSNTTDIDTILGDLVRHETRLSTQARLDGSLVDIRFVFAASQGRPQFMASRSSGISPTTYFPRSQSGYSNSSEIRCRHCADLGHPVSLCKKMNFCNYCKRPGNIISECWTKQCKGSFNNNNRGYGSSSYSGSSYIGSGHSTHSVTSADLVTYTHGNSWSSSFSVDQLI